jgi:cytochrome c
VHIVTRVRKRGARVILELVSLCMLIAGCDRVSQAPQGLAGDPERGRLLLRQYGCASCHTIPGVATARGNVGPPLGGVGQRTYLGGVVTNTPQNMVAWIRAPQKFDPPTAMPDLHVAEADAQDMVAYLYRIY